MNAVNDWLNGDPIEDAWWDVLSKRQKREYQKSKSDGARHHRRKEAAMALFSFLSSGVIKATAKELLVDGKLSDTPQYLDRELFRLPDFVDALENGRIEFSGKHFACIRLTFPVGWTDGENFDAGELESAPLAQRPFDREKFSKVGTRGRPSREEDIDRALAELHAEHGDELFRGAQDKIYDLLLKKVAKNPKNPDKGLGPSTVKKRISAFTKSLNI